MGMADFNEGFKSLARFNAVVKMDNEGMQKKAIAYRIFSKALGPVVDLWVMGKQAAQLFYEVFSDGNETLEEGAEAAEAALGPWGILLDIFGSIKTNLIFLISLFLGVSMALIAFTGSIGGATGAFPEFFEGFNRIKDSILAIIGHLRTIGGVILAADWSPILNAATMAIGGIIMIVMAFYTAAFGMIEGVLAKFAELFMFMADTGAIDILIKAVGDIMLAFIMVFDFIFQILDAFGINFDTIFGAVTILFGGFIDFLMNSGLIQFFVEVIGIIAAVLPPVVFVVGTILVWIAKLIAMLFGPLLKVIWNVGKIAVNVIAGAIAIVVAVFRTAFAYITAIVQIAVVVIGGILKLLVAIFTGDWEAIPGILSDIWDGIVGIVTTFASKLGDIFGDLYTSISNVFGNIYDAIVGAISGAIDFVLGPIDELLGKIDDMLGFTDAVSGFFGGVGDALGFSGGGIASGPQSGYPVALHGTEAVVPLPDGRSIPVALQGGGGTGGGDNISLNINVSGGGNAREIARAVSQEVQRTFRNRSRGSSFGRGV